VAIHWQLSIWPRLLPNNTELIFRAKILSKLTMWENYEYISTLAAVYSENGEFEVASKWQEKALSLLPKDCPRILKENYRTRLDLYKTGKSYHRGTQWSFTDGELVAHWEFDEVKNEEILDSSKNNLHGKLVGDAHLVSDPERGSVLSLDGDGDYVDCGNKSTFHINGSITLAVWVKAKVSESAWQDAITCWSWWIGRDPNESQVGFGGAFTTEANKRVRWVSSEGNINLDDGGWHHVVGISDGISIYTYVDGILEDFESPGGKLLIKDYPVYIGGAPEEPEKHWNGLIDDVRIYSYALSPEEVKMLYKGKEPPREKKSE